MVSTVSPESAAAPDRRWFARAVPASTRAARWLGGLSFCTRVLGVAAIYLVVTVGILTGILLQVRADTISAAEKLTASMVRLAADATAHALQSVDQTLTIAEAAVTRLRPAGTMAQATVNADFRSLLNDRPFLVALWVLDAQGRIVHHSRDEGPLGGKELADKVGRRWPSTSVVFMSGYTEDEITQDGRLDPGVRLLNKPFRKRELARMIRDALDGRG